MKRVTSTGYSANENGTGRAGYVDAVPGVSAGTMISASELNQIQEELALSVESAVALDADRKDQLRFATLARAALAACANARIAADSDDMGSATRNAFAISPAGTIVGVGVASGGTGGCDYSNDMGITWTGSTFGSSSSATFVNVVYDATTSAFYALGGEVQKVVNPSSTWTRVVSSSGSIVWYDLLVVGSTLLVFGTDGTHSYMRGSADGATWTAATTFTSKEFNHGHYATNGTNIVCGDDNGTALYYSTDGGNTFTASVSTTSGGSLGVFWCDVTQLFYAVGAHTVYTSTTGVAWALAHSISSLSGAVMTPAGLIVWSSKATYLVHGDGLQLKGWTPTAPGVRGAHALTVDASTCVVYSDNSSLKWVQTPFFTNC